MKLKDIPIEKLKELYLLAADLMNCDDIERGEIPELYSLRRTLATILIRRELGK